MHKHNMFVHVSGKYLSYVTSEYKQWQYTKHYIIQYYSS